MRWKLLSSAAGKMIRSIYSSRLRRLLELISAGRCALEIALIKHLTGEGVTTIIADKSQATVWFKIEKVRRFEPSPQYLGTYMCNLWMAKRYERLNNRTRCKLRCCYCFSYFQTEAEALVIC